VRAGAAAVRAAHGAPVVVTLHNAPVGLAPIQRGAHRLAERSVSRRSALVIAASRDLAERAMRAGAKQTLVLPVIAPAAHGDDAETSELPDAGGRIALAVARLAPQKRLDVLVNAAAAWSNDPAAPVVWIAGEGPERDSLQRRIDETRAPVRLLGRRSDIGALLARADVFVLSSEWEARPLAVQEAMRSGVAVVATAVGGVPDLVGDAAVLVPPGDSTELGDAIRRVLGDEALQQDLVARGHRQAELWPSLADSLAAVERAYDAVLHPPKH
jgi:glycosyltransferase involved in cell wall biosynthesis